MLYSKVILQPGQLVMTEPGTLVHMADPTVAELHWNSCDKVDRWACGEVGGVA